MHRIHGVGRYVGITHRELAGAERDYLILEYAEGDKLFVPSDQVGMVARYVGGDAPRLHRMGGSDWARATAKVKRAVRDMAGELVRLYTVRMSVPGHAFGPDTPWQQELEDAFPHEETGDQLTAIDEVKRDMELAKPMDRLDLRRRGVRQDRDRGARRVQGGDGGQAGRGARADHAARRAALHHVQRAVRALPGDRDDAEPVRQAGRAEADRRRPSRRARSTS